MGKFIFEEEDFYPGDLLWNKVGQYPFWPCMVSYAPNTGVHIRQIGSTGKKSYHVQYFGEGAQRGWTQYGSSNFFSFKSENEYFERVEILKSHTSIDKYKIQDIHKNTWQIALKEAEEALLIQNRRARFENYVFRFEKKKTSNGTDIPMDVDETFDPTKPSSSKRIKLSYNYNAVCDACQERNVDFSCSKQCGSFFHLGCYGLINKPKSFQCIDCLSSLTSSESSSHQDLLCFICNDDNEDEVIKCALFKCLKYYHLTCLSNYENKIVGNGICPHHTCLTCYRNNPLNILARKGPFVKCIKCPSAFHSQEICVPAGAVPKSELEIICPLHFVGKDKVSPKETCNKSTCNVCSNVDGVLICCKTCPVAIHKECFSQLNPPVPVSLVSSDKFICTDCSNRRYLHHGMVVFGKTETDKWWPAKIIQPSDLPKKLKKQQHYEGEFVVKYYGTNKYSWTHCGRIYPFSTEHLSFKYGGKEKLRIIGLKKAVQEYKKYLKIRNQLSKPEAFKHIKVNRALPPAQIMKDDTNASCSCDTTTENPCSAESGCLNYTTAVECHADSCKAKDLCQNQKFQKREYADTALIRTKICGWGLSTTNALIKGEFIMEYVGQVITYEEYRKRSEKQQKKGKKDCYFSQLDSGRIIDAGPMGNYSRFINHSCEPNCTLMKWLVNGDVRVGIFSIRNISPGEELTFDYQYDKDAIAQQCFCGAATCRKIIGKLPPKPNGTSTSKMNSRTPNFQFSINPNIDISKISNPPVIEAGPSKDSVSNNSSLVPKIVLDKISEASIAEACAPKDGVLEEQDAEMIEASIDNSQNHCFICQKTGHLIMCDTKGCIRAYHLLCVGLASIPKDTWNCVVHFCSVCGKTPTVFCKYCPMSICNECWKFGKQPVQFVCQLCELKKHKKKDIA